MTCVLKIEASSKSLRLDSTGVRADCGSYHFMTFARGKEYKVYVCHSIADCPGWRCVGRSEALFRSREPFQDVEMVGNNNMLIIDTSMSALSRLIVSGVNNKIVLDAGKTSSRTLLISVGGHCSSADINRMTVHGCLQCIHISTYTYLQVNASELCVHDGKILCMNGLMTVTCVQPSSGPHIDLTDCTPRVVSTAAVSATISNTSESSAPSRKRSGKAVAAARTKLPRCTNSDIETASERGQYILDRCPVCSTNLPNAACVPCGHVLCMSCARGLCKSLKKKLDCPILGCAKSEVDSVIHIYVPKQLLQETERSHSVEAITID